MTRGVLLLLAGLVMFLGGAIVVVMTAGWLAELATLGVCALIAAVGLKMDRKRRSAGIPSDAVK